MKNIEKSKNEHVVQGIFIETLYVVVMMVFAYIVGFVMVRL